jgi:hypothetical protein
MGIQRVERLHCEICKKTKDWQPYDSLPRPWMWASFRIGSMGAIAQFPDTQKLVCSLVCVQILHTGVVQDYCARNNSWCDSCPNCGFKQEKVCQGLRCDRCNEFYPLPEVPSEDDMAGIYRAKIKDLKDKLYAALHPRCRCGAVNCYDCIEIAKKLPDAEAALSR